MNKNYVEHIAWTQRRIWVTIAIASVRFT